MSDREASIVVSPEKVSLDDLAQVLAGAAVVLDPSCWPRVEAASAIVAAAARSEVPAYGINTGFGKLASKRIPPGQTALLQRNLIVSHCCGVGPPTPEPIVRLMMALKIVSLGRGASGVRRDIIEQLQAMLARRWCSIRPSGRASKPHRPSLRPPRVQKLRPMASIRVSESWRRNGLLPARPRCCSAISSYRIAAASGR